MRRNHSKNRHLGSDFDDFLAEHDLLADAEAVAIKRVLAFQLTKLMEKESISKSELARRMNMSCSALDRLPDPRNASVTLQTLERAAQALGKRLQVEFTACHSAETQNRRPPPTPKKKLSASSLRPIPTRTSSTKLSVT